ncbi:hypothetical protein JOL62DRAFT_612630 [Phyllosticta paracitricarpa]|uniref:Uncharacterized protein n=1 Tax=Phyllosticta paracitricarpa TaxID=2016321 RepID=A0ABR1N5H9_9PEZI
MDDTPANQPAASATAGGSGLSDGSIIAIVGLFLTVVVPLIGFAFHVLRKHFQKRPSFASDPESVPMLSNLPLREQDQQQSPTMLSTRVDLSLILNSDPAALVGMHFTHRRS